MAVKSRVFTTLFLTAFLSGTACLAPNNVWARGGGGSRGGSVHVSGYTRHDGTYVHPYTRSAPGSGSKYSGGSGYSTGSEYSGGSEYSSSNDPNPTATTSTTSTTSDAFQDALDSAMSAATLTQSAMSKDDWELVSSKWQNAISLLKQLPSSNPNYDKAQVKIQEYGRNLNYARQQLDLPPLTQPEEVTAQETVNNESQKNGESLAENSVPEASVAAPASSPLPNTSSPQATAVTAPVTSSTEDSNHSGITLIFTVLAVIVAAGFYKVKLLPKASKPDKTNPKQEVSNSNFWLELFSHVLSSHLQKKQPLTEVERLKEWRLRQKEERLRTEQRLKEERLKQQRLKEERLRAEQSLREKQHQTEEGFWEKLSKFTTEIGNALEEANQKQTQRQKEAQRSVEEQRRQAAQRQTTWNFWGTGDNKTKVRWSSWGGGDKVTVKGYQRKDGTYVKGYQRNKHK